MTPKELPIATERRSPGRRGAKKKLLGVGSPGRPRTDGSQLDADSVEFGKAMERYKRERRRPFPTFSEVLGVLKSLGYRKEPRLSQGAG